MTSIPSSFAVNASTLKSIELTGSYEGRQCRPRLMRGEYVPAIDSVIPTEYGSGTVVGYEGDTLRVAITDFNEDYCFISSDETVIRTAQEQVAQIASTINSVRWAMLSDWESRMVKDFGMSDKAFNEKYTETINLLGSNEVLVNIRNLPMMSDVLYMIDTIGYTEKDTESKAERKARLAMERKAAKRLANAMLADMDDMPDDIRADIDAEFGEPIEMDDETVGNWVDL